MSTTLCGRYNAGCFNLDALPGISVYSDQRFSPATDIHSTKMTSPQMPRRESLASISQRRLQAVKSKSIYVLPNAFTAAALVAAYYGIIQAMNGHFSEAAIAGFFSMLFDGMDGRVGLLGARGLRMWRRRMHHSRELHDEHPGGGSRPPRHYARYARRG